VKRFWLIFGCLSLAFGLFLLSGWQNAALSTALASMLGRKLGQTWPLYLQILGLGLSLLGAGLVFWQPIGVGWRKLMETGRQAQEKLDAALKTRLGSALDFSELPLEWPRFNRWDGLILVGFLLFAALYQLARLSPGFPNSLLSSDAANLAGFAAATQYPQLFPGDLVLSNPANFRLYSTIHIPLLRLLESLLGNFGLAFRVLLGPHVFLQLLGFYWLGRILFRSRFWGLILSLMAAAPTPLPVGEVWGIVVDALPRFTFQVVLVFLLGLAFLWRSRPRLWYGIMAFAGLMAFIHPISTPIWGATLLVGFWPVMPAEWPFKKRFWQLIKLGLVFSVALLPYLSIYLTSYQGGTRAAGDYNLLYTVLTEYFPDNIYDMPAALTAFWGAISLHGLIWFALLGLLLTFFLLPAERQNLSQVLFWGLGLLLATILLPWLEQIIEKRFRIIPLQTDLVRGIRYFVPLMLILWVFPLASLAQRLKNRWLVRGLKTLGLASAVFWVAVNPLQPVGELQSELACLASGKLICPVRQEFAQTLAAIKTLTPEKATFAVMREDWNNGTDVRYLSLRPLVYAFKDKGFLTYSNHTVLQRWYELFQLEREIYRKSTKPVDQRRMAVEFARETQADYLLTDFPYTPAEVSQFNLNIVYQNGTFMVLKLNYTR
jgi:hypothetical protein